MKKHIIAVIATFIGMVATDMIIHGQCMQSVYLATANLWRTEEEMKSFMPFMFLGQFLISLAFAVIFSCGYKGRGVMEGVRYGLMIAVMIVGSYLIQYAVTPMTYEVLIPWIVAAPIQAVLLGVINALIWQKEIPCQNC
jgi:hypothetical protein